ncbi:hypothetical protein [Streptomyces fuscichromogenes]|uniref:Uncharacterized protein n=1 Tax=Streptomyces fuscichromogenes TaxID=1324013 RepID=A0A917X826_9ACTN|nr:hypothetical protein [Streptomyces fuscichromogenes]GGM88879.1 hypothetical protein GCM10011578_005580 [Streptomyces fuscichromogenes]
MQHDASLHELFGRLIAFGREVAFIPVQDEPWGAVVVWGRHPTTCTDGLFS